MAVISTYDARDVSVSVDTTFVTGFAEGTFVSCEKDEDNFEAKVSAQGDVAVAKRNNTLATITITLNQTSPSIPLLNKLANSSKMVPIWVISNNAVKEKVGGTQAMVKKPADIEFSDEVSDREYEIQVFDYTVE